MADAAEGERGRGGFGRGRGRGYSLSENPILLHGHEINDSVSFTSDAETERVVVEEEEEGVAVVVKRETKRNGFL